MKTIQILVSIVILCGLLLSSSAPGGAALGLPPGLELLQPPAEQAAPRLCRIFPVICGATRADFRQKPLEDFRSRANKFARDFGNLGYAKTYFRINKESLSASQPGEAGMGAAGQPTSPVQWHTFYGSSESDYGVDIAVAADGSVFMLGSSTTSWQGDGGVEPLHPYAGNGDLVVVKLDSAGAYQWHTFYGSGDGGDSGNSIAVAGDGSVYFTGYSFGDWQGDGGTDPRHPYTGSADLVVVKLDSDGAYQWHTFYGTSNFDAGSGMAVDGAGDVYITEQTYSTPLEDNPGLPLQPVSEAFDLSVIKLDSQGALQWERSFGSSALDFTKDIAAAQDGSIFLTGYSAAGWLGDGGAGPLHPHSGAFDLVIVKLDSHGAYQWHTFYGSGADDQAEAIALTTDGSIYVTGFDYSSWLGDGGQAPIHAHSSGFGIPDIVLLKLDSQGAYQWHTFYGASAAEGSENYGSGVAADGESVYVTGRSFNNWQGDQGEEPRHPFSGVSDLFVLKLDAQGAYQWHTYYGSGEDDSAEGIALSGGARLYVTGWSYASWLREDGREPLHPYAGGAEIVALKLLEGITFINYYYPMMLHNGSQSWPEGQKNILWRPSD